VGSRTLIVDTNVLLFIDQGKELSKRATSEITAAAAADALYVSAISAWEIATLIRRGRLALDADPKTYLAHLFNLRGVREVAVSGEIGRIAGTLPSDLHGDPADRIIIATAQTLRLPLATRDRNIVEFAKKLGGFSCIAA
jgi:PIN domain nuclease of toxin-antitoxin system